MNKLIICLFAIVAFAGIALADELDQNFKDFSNKFKKDYSNLSKEELHRRQKNFQGNLKKIEEHNNDPTATYTLGINEYSDYDPSEFVEKMCRAVKPQESQDVSSTKSFSGVSVPLATSVDWSAHFLSVADQGQCGSCWAFAAVGTIESFNSIHGFDVPKLSEQNVLDCDRIDNGCSGGWPTTTFRVIKDNMGNKLASDKDYPYIARKRKCQRIKNQFNCNISSVFEYSVYGNDNEMMGIVSTKGPVTIAFKVSNSGQFQNYRGGIFYDSTCVASTETACPYVNHAMVLVGFGATASGEQYWIVRNSWGQSWGQNGYLKIAKGRDNTCHLTCYAMGIE